MKSNESMRYRLRLALILPVLAGGMKASAEEVYTATLTSTKGLQKRTAELTVTITSRVTDEEAERVLKILREQGSDAALAAIRDSDRGVAKITGGPSSVIRYVRVHPGQNGSRIIIITDRALAFPEDAPSPSAPKPEGSVGLIELTLDDAGRGRGNLVEALKVTVSPEGVFQVVTPGRGRDRRRERPAVALIRADLRTRSRS